MCAGTSVQIMDNLDENTIYQGSVLHFPYENKSLTTVNVHFRRQAGRR